MKLHITCPIQIRKSAKDVSNIIGDLNRWNTWSPWFHCEPTAQTSVTGEPQKAGQSLSWEGGVIGSGKMTSTEIRPARSVSFILEFFKPWRNKADVTFEIREVKASECVVNWEITLNLPFFLFFLKRPMTAMMTSDFNRGLSMLKELAETGAVVARSTYIGEKQMAPFHFLGKKISCKIPEISKHVHADFEELDKFVQNRELPPPSQMATVVYAFDAPSGVCEIAAGLCYLSRENLQVPAGFTLSEIPAHKALVVEHRGPYRHIGNAWSMVNSYQRSAKKKVNRKLPAYEVYKNTPAMVAEKDILSEIVLPIR